MRRSINWAYVVMVAIDQEGKAVEVPGLDLETEEERAEWQGGEKRYELRKQRRRLIPFLCCEGEWDMI